MNKNNYNPLPLSNIFLNKPFIVGNIQPVDLRKNQVWVADARPSVTSNPSVVIGDIVLNINPIPDDEEFGYASWVVVWYLDEAGQQILDPNNNLPLKRFAGAEKIFSHGKYNKTYCL